MNVEQWQLREMTRRHFFAGSGVGLGSLGLASLLSRDGHAAPSSITGSDAARATNPMAPREGHFPAKAKSVIHLFMNGGPSQVDTFDPKPEFVRVPIKQFSFRCNFKLGQMLRIQDWFVILPRVHPFADNLNCLAKGFDFDQPDGFRQNWTANDNSWFECFSQTYQFCLLFQHELDK